MGKKKTALLPSTQRVLDDFGDRLKLARLRRNLPVELVAERAGISRATLWAAEKGSPSVAMGIYVQILFALGLEKDLHKVAADDELGRKLQDAKLPVRTRAPRKKVSREE
ncbi:MAG: helix-turn-helix domain-containing protein [Spirochaetota bacterium]